MIEKSMREWLQTALATPNVYHTGIPQGVNDDCVTLQVTGKKREYTQAHTSTICTTTFLVGIWLVADNEISGYYDVKTWAENIREILEAGPTAGTLGSHSVYSITIHNETDTPPQYLEGKNEMVVGVNLTAEVVHTQ